MAHQGAGRVWVSGLGLGFRFVRFPDLGVGCMHQVYEFEFRVPKRETLNPNGTEPDVCHPKAACSGLIGFLRGSHISLGLLQDFTSRFPVL